MTRERGMERPSQVWDTPLEAGVVLIRSGGIGGGVPPVGLLVWLRGRIWARWRQAHTSEGYLGEKGVIHQV